jgi:uncharacterized protein YdiU (UPF0061 family)
MDQTLPDLRLPLDNAYARLPEALHARLDPTPVAAPRLIRLNGALAEWLGLDPALLASAAGVAVLAGNLVPAGATPIAMAYAGHQFGHFTPSLGDGRALLLGEAVRPDGARYDIQLKGSGPTPFSRRGDGRAALGPVLREYVVAEAMHALGIPTTRALAAVATGEDVFRETALPGAVLTRVAASHIRVGTFQYFAARRDIDSLRALADHAIARHDPAAAAAAHPYRALYAGVVQRQASLVARWLLVGFIHGVMNTDNCTLSGETIDYGPCAFLDAYDPGAVFSSIDHAGRYAYGKQPQMVHWNLARLAEAMLPLFDAQEEVALDWAKEAIGAFGPAFEATYLGGLARKIGIAEARDGDAELAQDLLRIMAEQAADFTLTFRALAAPDGQARALFADPAGFDAWALRWRARLAEEPDPVAVMRAVNPAVIPRNHLIEAAIVAAVEHQDFSEFHALVDSLAHPFADAEQSPPRPDQRVLATFCGT